MVYDELSPSHPLTYEIAVKMLPRPSSYCSPHDRPINRDNLLGQGIVTLFGKSADLEDDGLVSQRTILPGLEFGLLLH